MIAAKEAKFFIALEKYAKKKETVEYEVYRKYMSHHIIRNSGEEINYYYLSIRWYLN